MKVEFRDDNSVHITGYVNAVERNSKLLREEINGKPMSFYERIKRGTFEKALKRNSDVKVLLNHDDGIELASTSDGTAELREDSIGLHADVTITNEDVVAAAKENRLVGWSFGFYCNSAEMGSFDGDTIRTVTDMDLIEVSILDSTKTPAYDGTLIEAREARVLCLRDVEEEPAEDEAEEPAVEEKAEEIDLVSELTALKEMIDELLAKVNTAEEESEAEAEPTEEAAPAEEQDENRADESAQGRETSVSVEQIEMQARNDSMSGGFDYTEYEQRIAQLRKGHSNG